METPKKKPLLQISAIHEDLTFSKSTVFLWMKLSPAHYEFLTNASRETLVEDFNLALANILTSEEAALEGQLIVTSDIFDENEWKDNLLAQAAPSNPSPYFEEFLRKMSDHMYGYQFRKKSVYIGVKLGYRNDFSPKSSALKIPGMDVVNRIMTGNVDEYLTDKEIDFWESKARLLRFSLEESRLKAVSVTGAEIAYVIRKTMFPGMVAPTIQDLSLSNSQEWGKGELQTLLDGGLHNGAKYLTMTQEINGRKQTGYRATLCFTKFPAVLNYPEKEPWIHFVSLLAFPVDIFSRFTIEPSRKVRKQVTNKIKSIEDQAANMTSAGGSLNLEVQEQHQLGQYLEYALGKDDTPWLFARHRLVVEASTVEELNENCRKVIDHYKTLGITVVWSTNDQMSLFLESMPNDKVRLDSYHQRHELSIMGAGVPTGTGGVGDQVSYTSNGRAQGWLGPYLGYTTSRVVEPVFLSVHSAISKNNPPGLVITGSPGSGKSFTAFTLTYNMVLSGVWTIYIDPKGEALQMQGLPGCENATIVNLQEGMDGLLDPFSMSNNPAIQKDLVLEVIGLFLGGIDQMGPETQTALAKSVQIASRNRKPSLTQVVELLLASPDPWGEALGQRLDTIRGLPFARLCFAPANERQVELLRPDKDLTIITLLGLDLPNSATPRNNYSNANRLAVAIMYLLTSFTRNLMTNADHSQPKAIVIDEAWAVTSTAQGARMVLEVARMGRSLNTALILVSQNAGDFLGANVTNSVSIRMAFRSKTEEEIENVLNFFDLDVTRANRDVIRNLNVGECLIRDADGRIARVQVDPWNAEMALAFETNPEVKRKNAAEAALAAV